MNTTQKIKYALCVPLYKLQASYRKIYNEFGFPIEGRGPQTMQIDPTFFQFTNADLQLVDRAVCETNRNLRQIIPYISLVDSDNKIFVYSRGGEGGEGRLIGKLSIGLGGHMDLQIPEATSFATWLSVEGNRELAEEAGLEEQTLSFTHLIADTDDVGCVHVGVLTVRHVSAKEKAALSPEAGCIEKGEWLSISELLAPQIFDRLEGWSKLVAILLQNGDSIMLSAAITGQVGITATVISFEAQEESNQLLKNAAAVIGKTESGAVLGTGSVGTDQ